MSPRGHEAGDALLRARARIIRADCLETMRELEPCSVDSVVTDPPYGLSFMGKDWDHGIPGVHFWEAALRVAKPGAHLLAFGGTRTFHRLAVAIEDAGWEIRDTVMWVYGSGFPKSLDVSKAIDKAAGAEREIRRWRSADSEAFGHAAGFVGRVCLACGRHAGSAAANCQCEDAAPATPDAERWQGWGTALKPAWEPIIVARKPLELTVAQNVLRYGTGGLNVDGCRVEAEKATGWGGGGSKLHEGGLSREGGEARLQGAGRWPANLIHDGSEEVVGLFPRQAGASAPVRGGEPSTTGQNGILGHFDRVAGPFHGDSGSAARFFYCAKASRADREEGLEGAAGRFAPTMGNGIGGKEHDPETATPKRNHHPTVKPTALMRYLCRLVTPPGGLVLDPFCGSGSTGKAAVLEGFRFLGIELDPEYAEIAEARIAAADRAKKIQPELFE